MDVDQFHEELENLVAEFPEAMSFLVQVFGPVPDYDTDEDRGRAIATIHGILANI